MNAADGTELFHPGAIQINLAQMEPCFPKEAGGKKLNLDISHNPLCHGRANQKRLFLKIFCK